MSSSGAAGGSVSTAPAAGSRPPSATAGVLPPAQAPRSGDAAGTPGASVSGSQGGAALTGTQEADGVRGGPEGGRSSAAGGEFFTPQAPTWTHAEARAAGEVALQPCGGTAQQMFAPTQAVLWSVGGSGGGAPGGGALTPAGAAPPTSTGAAAPPTGLSEQRLPYEVQEAEQGALERMDAEGGGESGGAAEGGVPCISKGGGAEMRVQGLMAAETVEVEVAPGDEGEARFDLAEAMEEDAILPAAEAPLPSEPCSEQPLPPQQPAALPLALGLELEAATELPEAPVAAAPRSLEAGSVEAAAVDAAAWGVGEMDVAAAELSPHPSAAPSDGPACFPAEPEAQQTYTHANSFATATELQQAPASELAAAVAPEPPAAHETAQEEGRSPQEQVSAPVYDEPAGESVITIDDSEPSGPAAQLNEGRAAEQAQQESIKAKEAKMRRAAVGHVEEEDAAASSDDGKAGDEEASLNKENAAGGCRAAEDTGQNKQTQQCSYVCTCPSLDMQAHRRKACATAACWPRPSRPARRAALRPAVHCRWCWARAREGRVGARHHMGCRAAGSERAGRSCYWECEQALARFDRVRRKLNKQY